MKVIAQFRSEDVCDLVEVAAPEFDKIASHPSCGDMIGLPSLWREGSNPPVVWPKPHEKAGISVRVAE